MWRTSGSVPTCEELESPHSCPYHKKKLNRLKISIFAWTHQKPRWQGNPPPWNMDTSETRKLQLRSAYLEQKCWSHEVVGTLNGYFDEFLEAKCGLAWEWETSGVQSWDDPPRPPILSWFLPPKIPPSSCGEDLRKTPLFSGVLPQLGEGHCTPFSLPFSPKKGKNTIPMGKCVWRSHRPI